MADAETEDDAAAAEAEPVAAAPPDEPAAEASDAPPVDAPEPGDAAAPEPDTPAADEPEPGAPVLVEAPRASLRRPKKEVDKWAHVDADELKAYGGRAEILPVGPGVAMSVARTAPAVRRCRNQLSSSSYGSRDGVGAGTSSSSRRSTRTTPAASTGKS